MSSLSPFHLAIPVSDLNVTAAFYEGVLGCTRGRESTAWIDLSLFGHQLVLHQVEQHDRHTHDQPTNPVDGEDVPVPHFGVVLEWDAFAALVSRIQKVGTGFVIGPTTRFEGRAGEQRTCFLRDPSGNCLEFKTFKDPSMLFTRDLEKYE
ncbi:MAG: VOC family protein [Gammaproteobacteria bacterium]